MSEAHMLTREPPNARLRGRAAARPVGSTCAGCGAPARTRGTGGWLASQPIARSTMLCPADSANASSLASVWKLPSVSTRSAMPPAPARRVPSGAGSPWRYLPVRKPLASGKYGSTPSP